MAVFVPFSNRAYEVNEIDFTIINNTGFYGATNYVMDAVNWGWRGIYKQYLQDIISGFDSSYNFDSDDVARLHFNNLYEFSFVVSGYIVLLSIIYEYASKGTFEVYLDDVLTFTSADFLGYQSANLQCQCLPLTVPDNTVIKVKYTSNSQHAFLGYLKEIIEIGSSSVDLTEVINKLDSIITSIGTPSVDLSSDIGAVPTADLSGVTTKLNNIDTKLGTPSLTLAEDIQGVVDTSQIETNLNTVNTSIQAVVTAINNK